MRSTASAAVLSAVFLLACGDRAEDGLRIPRSESATNETLPPDEGSVPAPAAPSTTGETTGHCPSTLSEAIDSSSVWSVAERVLGEGWLRFHPTSGTADWLPQPAGTGGLLSCSQPVVPYEVDAAAGVIRFDLPAPCRAVTLSVEQLSCPSERPEIETLADLRVRVGDSEGTEGILARVPAKQCNASFTSCSYPR